MTRKKTSTANPIKLKGGLSIGTGNAETEDEILEQCFLDNEFINQFTDTLSPKMIIDGRTGAGKTAIIKQILLKQDYSTEIDPTEISVSYISNSDILSFLYAIDADLDLLFQILWKHIIIIEYIKLRWRVNDQNKSRTVFQFIKDKIKSDPRKQKALEYLEKWQGTFWITTDENIKEITQHYEKNIESEMALEINKYKAGGQYQKRMSEGHKEELRQRVRKIIDTDLLRSLSSVVDSLSEISKENKKSKNHFILIDKLDEKWVDDKIKFSMINSLSDSLKSFRKIRDLKVIVALRSDVRERCLQEVDSSTFQREKIDDYAERIMWNKSQLKEIVDKRLQYLFERQYSRGDIKFDVLFDAKVGAKKTFDWMIERTLWRPRDIITFVNEALVNSQGNFEISTTALRNSERGFSQKRRDALFQEWYSAFPTLEILMRNLISKGISRMTLYQLLNSNIADEIALEIYSGKKIFSDPLYDWAKKFADGKVNKENWVRYFLSVGYRTSLIGIKNSAHEPYQYSHINYPVFDTVALTEDTKIKIHPMLLAAYGLHEAAR